MVGCLGEAERLERRFDAAMRDIYHSDARLGYRPTCFLEMAVEHGGAATADQLLADDERHKARMRLGIDSRARGTP